MKIFLTFLYVILSGLGLILIKLGSASFKVASGMFNVSMNWVSLIGFVCYICSFLLFSFYVLKNYDLTYIMPIVTALIQIITLFAGLFIFRESISTYGYIGIVLAVAGIVFMNIG